MTGVLTVCLALSAGSPADRGVTTDRLDDLAARARRDRVTCGPVAVWYCLGRTGRPADVGEVIAAAPMDDRGTDLAGLVALAARFGGRAELRACDTAELASLPVPSILVIGSHHCLVYEGVSPDGQTVTVFEPADGRTRVVPASAVRAAWTGEVITFTEAPLSPAGFASVAGLVAVGVWAIPPAVLVVPAGPGRPAARAIRWSSCWSSSPSWR
jgi:hypothetical protein